MYYPGVRSPDSMRPQPRQPSMSPYEHQTSYGMSSRVGDGGGSGSTRSRQRPPSQREQDQASWPNPWLRRNWDPENPLDLNKAPEQPQDDPDEEESTRSFQPAFAMDLNDLVRSLWTPAKPPPPMGPQYTSRRSGSPPPPPPQPGLPEYSVPATVRDVWRHLPRYDDRPAPEDFGSRTWRLDDPHVSYDGMDGRPRRARPPPNMRDVDPWSDDDEDSRYRRYREPPPQYDDPRARRPAYDPRMSRDYPDREYEQPPPRRAMMRPPYSSRYEARYDGGGYDSSDDYSRRAPPVDPRVDPRADPYYDDRMQPPRRVDPRYAAEIEAMRYQEELERRWIEERLRVDRRMHDAPPRTDPRMNQRGDPRMDPRMDPRIDPRMDPRVDPRVDPRIAPRMDPRVPTHLQRTVSEQRMDPREEVPLRRTTSDPRVGHSDPRMASTDDPRYQEYQRDSGQRGSGASHRSSHLSSPRSSSSSSSRHPSYIGSPASEPHIVHEEGDEDRDSIDSVEF